MTQDIITFQFRDLQELLDFEQQVIPQVLIISQEQLCISGPFTDAETELAKNGYHATIRLMDDFIY